MKNIIAIIVFFFAHITVFGQTIYKELDAETLPEKRQIKIQIPRNYEKNTHLAYPVIVVLDGDYLFEPVAGVTDYYAYWDEMPDAIIVGVNQFQKKEDDFMVDEINGVPSETGAQFFEFITLDLFKFLDNNYRTTKFRTIVGHGDSANFLNFYLFQEQPFFQAYISLSPVFTPKMDIRLKDQFDTLQSDIFYSLTTAEDDRKKSKAAIGGLHKSLNMINNEKFHYNYNYYKGVSHYELAPRALPSAIELIFEDYKPITLKEYKEEVLGYEGGTAYDYLVKKYERIKTLYGIDKRIRINDFNAAEAALKKNEDWEAFELLGKLAKDEYPETMLGIYYTAVFYENTGKPKKAMRAYQTAYTLEEIGNLTKDDMLHYADMIKADFGY